VQTKIGIVSLPIPFLYLRLVIGRHLQKSHIGTPCRQVILPLERICDSLEIVAKHRFFVRSHGRHS